MATIADQIAEARKAGYSDDEIRQFMSQTPQFKEATSNGYDPEDIYVHLGIPSKTGVIPTVARETKFVGGQLMQGAASFLGLPGDVVDLANKYGPNWLTRPLGSPAGTPPAPNPFYNSADEVAGVRNLGLAGPEPMGDIEEYAGGALKGIGANILPMALGLPPTAGIASGAAGGASAEAAHKMLPDSVWAPIIAGAVGGMGGEGVTGTLLSGMARRGASILSGEADLASSMQGAAQNMVDELASKNKSLGLMKKEMDLDHGDLLDQALKEHQTNLAGAKQAAQDAIDAAHATANEQIGTTATGIHPAKTLQDAGEAAQQGARTFLTNTLPTKLKNIWDPIDKAVPPDVPVELSAFKSALDNINSKAGTLEPLNKLLKPALPQSMSNALTAVGKAQELGVASAPSWSDLRTLRTSLGDAMTNPKVLNDIGSQNVAHLYAALTGDMKSVAQAHGIGDAFDAANAQSRQLYNFTDAHVSKLVNGPRPNADDPNPEAVAKSLLAAGQSGGTTLQALRQHIPEAVDPLASAGITQGMWTKMSPEAKAALIPDGQARAALDSVHSTRDSAIDLATQSRNAAVEDSTSNLQGIRDQVKTEKRTVADKVLENQKALNAAQSALDAAKGKATYTQAAADAAKEAAAAKKAGSLFSKQNFPFQGTALGTIGAHFLGENLGDVLTNVMGLPESAASTVGAVTAGLPIAYNVARAVVRNPKLLVGPTIGANAGGALAAQGPGQ